MPSPNNVFKQLRDVRILEPALLVRPRLIATAASPQLRAVHPHVATLDGHTLGAASLRRVQEVVLARLHHGAMILRQQRGGRRSATPLNAPQSTSLRHQSGVPTGFYTAPRYVPRFDIYLLGLWRQRPLQPWQLLRSFVLDPCAVPVLWMLLQLGFPLSCLLPPSAQPPEAAGAR